MGEYFARRTPLDWPSVGERISERRVGRIGGEVGVIRQPLGIALARPRGKYGVACCTFGQRAGPLKRKPGQGRGELLRTEQRARRDAGRDGGKGALSKRAEPVLQRQCPRRREDAPLVELAPRDLADGTRLDDLCSIVACVLRFSQAHTGCFVGKIHLLVLQVRFSVHSKCEISKCDIYKSRNRSPHAQTDASEFLGSRVQGKASHTDT